VTTQTEPTWQYLLVSYAEDPLIALSRRLLDDHRDALPRLEHTTVLLPDIEAAPRLRRVLLQQAATLGHDALLGPQILSWRSWLNTFPVGNSTVADDHRRELILVEALREHPSLFGQGNLWALADSLITLFDELTLNKVGLPNNLEDFTHRIGKAYGLDATGHRALEREAQLVHTLWHAWHEELHARHLIDGHTRHLLQLASALEADLQEPIYLLPPTCVSYTEAQWLAEMLQGNRLTLLLHGQLDGAPSRPLHPQSPLQRLVDALGLPLPESTAPSAFSRLLDAIYNPSAEHDMPLRERAQAFATAYPHSPAAERLSVLAADGDEEEAHAVELQVRRWLLSGITTIGIVTENRRLARRVRALLERAGITLQDAAGWALSTTSAAAVLERWLECIEEDFPQLAMLDLLKSPFFVSELPREEHLNRVFRLEQDIIQHENIGSGLSRYRENLHYRQQRMPQELATRLEPVARLLSELEAASASVQPYVHGAATPVATLLQALLDGLTALGLDRSLGDDAAGVRLLEELSMMQQAVASEAVHMSWLEFRTWLGRTLERFHFRPPTDNQSVSLLGPGQTRLARFDALIIAGAEREHLPGAPAATPFFNDAVRRELGLPSGDQQMAERFSHFRRLLESAPQILLSYRCLKDGETILPSPWLESLRAFHLLAYNNDLHAAELAAMLNHPDSMVVHREAPLPPPSKMPAPGIQSALLPQRYSASAYQQLMNCPYQFYAARGLALAPPEAIREALAKSDYGERVHLCLQAFHGDVAELPGPFTGRLTMARRTEAETLLRRISQRVFAADLEDNFLHRGWLQRWLEKIPAYLDWHMEREERWRVNAVEHKAEQSDILPGITLHGRLDRIDTDGRHQAVVDYKTGRVPSLEEVASGEAVQLPFYALLCAPENPVAEVAYLALDEKHIRTKLMLQQEDLDELSTAIGKRLMDTVQAMQHGAPLPAWGDDGSCGYCSMGGVCRRQAWEADIKKTT
jgi:ATP-dependent helicase/nuclease subunit B